MQTSACRIHSRLLISGVLVVSGLCGPVSRAEVIRDGSIGPGTEVQINGPNYEIRQEHGEVRGNNLFHSFERFSIRQGESATFSGQAAIRNIISRVTGGEVSSIDGHLAVQNIPGANLFLLNPNGVIFGAHASIDVPGTFYASTAPALLFDNGESFQVQDGGAPVLSVSNPVHFGFLNSTAATPAQLKPIQLVASTLQLNGDTGGIALEAGDIELRDGAQVQLESEHADAKIALRAQDRVLLHGRKGAANENSPGSLLKISNANAAQSGGIEIQAARVELRDGAEIKTDNWNERSGAILIQGDELRLSGGAHLQTNSYATNAQAVSGDIKVDVRNLYVDNAAINSVANDSGKGGDIKITATDTVALGSDLREVGGGQIHSKAKKHAHGGAIQIKSGKVVVTRSASLWSLTEGQRLGDESSTKRGGDIGIDTGDLRIAGGGISAQAREDIDGGNIAITARELAMTGGSSITTISAGSGIKARAGDIAIVASGDIVLGNGAGGPDAATATITADTRSGSHGDVGSIDVQGRSISLLNGGQIEVGGANAGASKGAIRLLAKDRIIVDAGAGNGQPQIRARGAQAPGTADIELQARAIELRNGAVIDATTDAASAGTQGSGIKLTATESIVLSGSNGRGTGVSLRTETKQTGNYNAAIANQLAAEAGDIHLRAPVIEIRDGAQLKAGTETAGRGGQIDIRAAERLTLAGFDQQNASVRVEAGAVGEGLGGAGDIHLAARTIELKNGAAVTAGTSSAADGGTVSVDAERLTLSGRRFSGQSARTPHGNNNDGSSIRAGTDLGSRSSGNAGSIYLRAGVLELRDDAYIDANTRGSGEAGMIRIEGRRASLYDKSDIGSTSTQGGGQRGASGRVRINLTETLDINDSFIHSDSSEQVGGGAIDIQAGQAIRLNGGTINTTNGSGSGSGGKIRLRTHLLANLNGSRITAGADQGQGGNVEVRANYIVQTRDSQLNAKATGSGGVDGTVELASLRGDLQSELQPLNGDFLDAARHLRPSCQARALRSPGHFEVRRLRGTPLSPEGPLLAFDHMVNARVRTPLPAGAAQVAAGKLRTAAMSFRGGHYKRAVGEWQAAVAGYAQAGDAAAHSDVLRGLAQAQLADGRFQEAAQQARQALAQAQAANDATRMALALGALSNASYAMGEIDSARRMLKRAVRLSRGPEHAQLRATLMNNLGNQLASQADPEQALAQYLESAQLAQGRGDAVAAAKALANAARVLLEDEQAERAGGILEQAAAAIHRLPPGHEQAVLLIHLAKSQQQWAAQVPGQGQAALGRSYEALRLAERLSRELAEPRTRSYALGNLGALYQQQGRSQEALYLTRQALESAAGEALAYRWHWQEGQLLLAQGQRGAAIAAYRRAVEILEETRGLRLQAYDDVAANFRQRVAPVYLDLVDALLREAGARPVQAKTGLLRQARATVEQLKAAELRNYFRDECIADLQAKSTQLDQVSPQAAVVYPILLPDRLELLVSLPTGLQRYRLPVPAEQVRQTVRRYRYLLEGLVVGEQQQQLAQQLYDWLVRPYAHALAKAQIRTLVFVPDGALRTIPMTALHDGKDYLVRRYGVVVTPGLSLTDPRPLRRTGSRVLLAGLSKSVQGFPALPQVPKELQRIQRIFGGRVLLDEEFTLRRVQQALAQPATVVHIASHAQFNGRADGNFLLTYDGRLSLDQLNEYLAPKRFSREPVELLVLSACQTAAGDDQAALGLAGVGIKAGARSALGSLWDISDEATETLIVEFYRQLKRPKMTKARALQAAQAKLLDDPKFSHPFYWSPFLLINNWL